MVLMSTSLTLPSKHSVLSVSSTKMITIWVIPIHRLLTTVIIKPLALVSSDLTNLSVLLPVEQTLSHPILNSKWLFQFTLSKLFTRTCVTSLLELDAVPIRLVWKVLLLALKKIWWQAARVWLHSIFNSTVPSKNKIRLWLSLSPRQTSLYTFVLISLSLF